MSLPARRAGHRIIENRHAGRQTDSCAGRACAEHDGADEIKVVPKIGGDRGVGHPSAGGDNEAHQILFGLCG